MGCAGFDFLVADMEHTPVDPPQVVDILRAIACTPASAVTRVPWNDLVLIKRALDAGAQTIMLPYVQNAEEAKRAVAATRYPPEGLRGVAGSHRGSRYGTVRDYLIKAASELCVIVQIETDAAARELDAIARVPGVDSIFVGPNDLAASMGHLGRIGDDAVQQRLAFVAQACRRLGTPCGILGSDPASTTKYLGFGYTWVAISSDIGMMVGRAQEYLAAVRAGAEGMRRSP